MKEKPERSEVHFLISNQSRSLATAELHIAFGDKKIRRQASRSESGHAFEEVSVSVPTGPRDLLVREKATGASERRPIQVSKELWITILFFGGTEGISIAVSDQPVAIH
jgi:hypothetical protein